MIKKILFFALTFLINAITFSQVFTSNSIKYNITDATNKKVEVSTNTNFTGTANIPQAVIYNGQNYTVTSIGDNAFSNCSGLSSVIIPSTVSTIGNYAFNNDINLTSVIFPNSVTSIGQYSFSNTGITSLTLPSSVTNLDNGAFYGCTRLNTINIPNVSMSVGNRIFSFCTSLTSVTIPSAFSVITYGMFSDCTSLTNVTIHSNVSIIQQYAFSNCTALNTINCNVTRPINIDSTVFNNVNKTSCTLKVPSTSLTAYQNATIWKDFLNISGLLATESFNSKKSTISVYPNPASEKISVKSETAISKVELYDLSGKKLKESASKEMNISTIPNGNYLLKITDKNGNTETQKLIKK